jgi:hypothetical protein
MAQGNRLPDQHAVERVAMVGDVRQSRKASGQTRIQRQQLKPLAQRCVGKRIRGHTLQMQLAQPMLGRKLPRASGAHQNIVIHIANGVTRPVRELKAFKRVYLKPGQSELVEFELGVADLSFYRRDGSFGPEPGGFCLWTATSSEGGLKAEFSIEV